MTEWILDLSCLWRTANGVEPCQYKLEKPWIILDEDGHPEYARTQWYLSRFRGWLPMAGADLAQVKRLAIEIIQTFLEWDEAELVDAAGQPIDLQALTPIVIDDYNDVERVPPPGHPTETPWRIDRQCVWTEAGSSRAFRLRVSSRLDLLGLGRGYRIAADHPLLGDLMIHDSSGYTLGHAIPDLADWHRARILDEHGSPVDFEALANQLRSS